MNELEKMKRSLATLPKEQIDRIDRIMHRIVVAISGDNQREAVLAMTLLAVMITDELEKKHPGENLP